MVNVLAVVSALAVVIHRLVAVFVKLKHRVHRFVSWQQGWWGTKPSLQRDVGDVGGSAWVQLSSAH